jgi:UDP-N-acetylglucosamine 2-epimerase (non-hydrolysing)
MSAIFKKLDENFNHFLCHTGQHYDKMLSDIFFDELEIRKPDFNLEIGGKGKEHFHQLADVSVKLIELIRREKLNPDLILFLGDSNSSLVAAPLKKEGYRIGHIEAGMRSGDKRMLEEINRTCCDHCSDFLFVYHEDYKQNLLIENIPEKDIFVVGNTIVEVCQPFLENIFSKSKTKDFILMDIHRPENFNYPERLKNIFEYAKICKKEYKVPIKMIGFGRTLNKIKEHGIDIKEIDIIDLMSYKNFLKAQYNSLFMISDSGTAQEEPALLNTAVIVPRDFTERPQSVDNGCSFMIKINNKIDWNMSFKYIENAMINYKWLGDGKTSKAIINILQKDK